MIKHCWNLSKNYFPQAWHVASSDVARQSCPVSSRCLALVRSPAAWGLWCLWLGRCRGRTADDLPALQHAASDPGQSEPRSRILQPIRDQFTCSARVSKMAKNRRRRLLMAPYPIFHHLKCKSQNPRNLTHNNTLNCRFDKNSWGHAQ